MEGGEAVLFRSLVISVPGHFETVAFDPVISVWGRFGPGAFGTGHFGPG